MILRSPKKATSMRIRLQRLTEYMGNRSNANDPGASTVTGHHRT